METVLALDDARRGGTRFMLRAGKALAHQRKLVRFRFHDGGELELGIDGPKEVVLRLRSVEGAPVELVAPAPRESLPAHAHVLADILSGRSDHLVGAEEAEEAWRVVEPVGAAWKGGEVPLERCVAGSGGPA